MGASESKEIDKDLSLFSPEDKQVIAALFGSTKLDHLSTVPRAKIFEQLLIKCNKEHDIFVNRFCDILSECTAGKSHISLKNYVSSAAKLLKGPVEGKASIVIYLASGRKDHASSSEIMWYLKAVLSIFRVFSILEPTYKSWEGHLAENPEMTDYFCQFLAKDLFYSDVPAKQRGTMSGVPEKEYRDREVSEWLLTNHVLSEIHQMLFARIFNLSPPPVVAPLIPMCNFPKLNNGYKPYLSFPEVIFANTALPLELRDEWRLLFSTSAHGESFAAMIGNIVERGPSLVFVEDKHGHKFGGFAAEDWRINPHFYGKPAGFLFSLKPFMAMFSCTGYNENYQYLNLKCKTFPNGLGFGGQLEYFCLWIDCDFGKGYCSPTSSTYGCPQLSHAKDFEIRHLEVWGVGAEPKKEVSERLSILDVDMEAVAMLKIVGKKPVSEGLREADPMADIPGETELPPLDTALYGSSP